MESSDVVGLAAIGTNLFAGTAAYSGGVSPGVYVSTDNGSNWKEVYTSLWPYGWASIATSGTNLFVAIDSSVFLSIDSGRSWAVKDSGLPGANMSSLAVNGTNLFVSNDYGVYGSSNNGDNWAPANTGLPENGGGDFTWIGSTVFAGTGNGVYFSTNDGASWLPVPLGSPAPTEIQCLKTIGGAHLFAATSGALYLSNNNGTTWGKLGTGLPNTVGSIDYGNSNLYLGTSAGVWRSEILDLNSVAENSQILDASAQAYPNPFPTKTSITISPSESGFAAISIVNLLGQEIARLFSGDLEAGEHSFSWDASAVTPGTYWCIARMGGQAERIALSVQR
jgi:hypothetical protein